MHISKSLCDKLINDIKSDIDYFLSLQNQPAWRGSFPRIGRSASTAWMPTNFWGRSKVCAVSGHAENIHLKATIHMHSNTWMYFSFTHTNSKLSRFAGCFLCFTVAFCSKWHNKTCCISAVCGKRVRKNIREKKSRKENLSFFLFFFSFFSFFFQKLKIIHVWNLQTIIFSGWPKNEQCYETSNWYMHKKGQCFAELNSRVRNSQICCNSFLHV